VFEDVVEVCCIGKCKSSIDLVTPAESGEAYSLDGSMEALVYDVTSGWNEKRCMNSTDLAAILCNSVQRVIRSAPFRAGT